MPLDTADTFADTPPDDLPARTYPAPPGLFPLSFLFGYSERDRARYTSLQAAATTRLLALPLTPTELAGLAYYDGVFYAYESYGDVLGTTAGVLLGLALRARKPGRVPAALARVFGASPQYVAVGLRVAVFGSLGRLYGLTTAGVQALNRMRHEQKADPAMARVVAARAKKLGALEREVRARAMGYPPGKEREGRAGYDDDRDEQSLGGMEFMDQQRRSDEDAGGREREAFPFGRPSEAVAAQRQQQVAGEGQGGPGDDPFSFSEEKEAPVEAPARGGWRNTHSNTGESAWERLRKGQRPQSRAEDEDEAARPQSQSPWPQRRPMKGFGPQSDEPKTDSFSFSSTAEDRELAKAQAQKEFDESVERERRSGGDDGYSEGDQGRRGRW